MTKEKMQAMVAIFSTYPETMLRQIVHPVTGMATKFQFLPGLKDFKDYCEQVAAALAAEERATEAHERFVRGKSLPPPKSSQSPQEAHPELFWGPMEDIRPGDRFHWSRVEEWKNFMRSRHGIREPRILGVNEVWIDSGARPFDLPAKPNEGPKEDNNNPNPFG